MKQALQETAKGTADAVPAIVKADPTTRDIEPIKARRRWDEITVEMVLNIEHDKGKPKVQTRLERDLWRAADELAGPSPTPLIRSLALTVALCENDVRDRQVFGSNTNLSLDRRVQTALNGSMRRYLAACKMLATVQRLDLPPVQVNVATNQVVSNG